MVGSRAEQSKMDTVEKCALLLGWTLRLPRVPSSCRMQDTSALFPSSQISNLSFLLILTVKSLYDNGNSAQSSSYLPAPDLQTSRSAS
jgi:hypothetical protein